MEFKITMEVESILQGTSNKTRGELDSIHLDFKMDGNWISTWSLKYTIGFQLFGNSHTKQVVSKDTEESIIVMC